MIECCAITNLYYFVLYRWIIQPNGCQNSSPHSSLHCPFLNRRVQLLLPVKSDHVVIVLLFIGIQYEVGGGEAAP